MAEKIKFTAAAISALESPKKGRIIYQDTDNKYLNLFVTPSAKTFYYIRKSFGHTMQIKIGAFPDVKLAKAKVIHNEHSDQIARGIDPTKAKREKRQEMSFADLFGDYLENYAKVHKKTWKNDENMFDNHLSSLSGMKLSTITGDHIAYIIRKLAEEDKKTTANRIISLISKVFNYAIHQKRLSLQNPATGMKKFSEKVRKRFLHPDEMAAFFKAIEKLKKKGNTGELMSDFFLMLLFAGQRRGVTMAMRWDEIDTLNQVWVIPGDKTKNADDNIVTLCEQSMQILRRRKNAQEKKSSEWVFPCKFDAVGQGHISEPKKAWKFIREESGLNDLRMHDLRRSLGSWQAALGSSMKVIGDSLNHKSLDITNKVYAQLTIDPIRDSVSAAVDAMTKAAEKGQK